MSTLPALPASCLGDVLVLPEAPQENTKNKAYSAMFVPRRDYCFISILPLWKGTFNRLFVNSHDECLSKNAQDAIGESDGVYVC
mmetsp:Transcript_34230/g.72071  ORF Transcript_34230/g.72071 Transcript_34230/m.72071 type:complete len:84 (+) Transcript_34230:1269-1520(+)